MRVTSVPGKLVQLWSLPWSNWGEFTKGWLRRERLGRVPCVLPYSKCLLQIPLREFYESYWFFCESRRGRDELRYFLDRVQQGDIIYDIGAFRGAYGAAAKAAFGDKVSVHLFEPIQANVERIRIVSQLNNFRQFEIIGKAVGLGTTITGRLDARDEMLRQENLSNTFTRTELPSISVDAYMEESRTIPSIIKMDVEGFELEVIEGARKCLLESRPRLWLELHPNFLAAQGKRWESAIEILQSLGYDKTIFFKDYEQPTRDLAFHVWCENKPE
jgi:FkbM family methyltransferase